MSDLNTFPPVDERIQVCEHLLYSRHCVEYFRVVISFSKQKLTKYFYLSSFYSLNFKYFMDKDLLSRPFFQVHSIVNILS